MLLIDRSASMAAGTAGATPFAKAQRQAAELIARPARRDRGPPGVFRCRRGRSRPGTAQIDAAIRPGLAGTDYTKALGWARDIVVASRRLKRQVFLSDRPSAVRSRPAACRRLSADRGDRA